MSLTLVLYNPQSGVRRERREGEIETVFRLLCERGVEARASRTESSADAAAQARAAVEQGYERIFACGGDGTIHDVLQGMVGSQVPLAVIPRGTANALAHDLGVPADLKRAVDIGLNGQALRVPVGKIQCQSGSGEEITRFFTVTAGVGADAALFYQLGAKFKSRFGIAAYCAKAFHIWFSQQLPYFEAELGSGERLRVTQVLAVRLRDFGNVLRELAPGASLTNDKLRLLLFRTDGKLNYLAYVLRGLLGLRAEIPGIELRDQVEIACRELAATPAAKKTYVEVDGELVGRCPAKISMVPDALTLMAARERKF